MRTTNTFMLLPGFAFCLVAMLISIPAIAANDAEPLSRYMQSASESLQNQQLDALDKIRDDKKRYLAMTYYLRAGKTIALRWSWTNEQIKAYEQSEERATTLAEIQEIAAQFSKENPKHVLYTNTQVRSLEQQLARWEVVRSIDVAANTLYRAAIKELKKDVYPPIPDATASKRFREFLIAWRASPSPTLAAPGFSLHGKGRAYDFQIRDLQGRTVAGTDSSTIRQVWDGQGWTEKLSKAVHGASNKFVGPLVTPREPWHYEYRPDSR